MGSSSKLAEARYQAGDVWLDFAANRSGQARTIARLLAKHRVWPIHDSRNQPDKNGVGKNVSSSSQGVDIQVEFFDILEEISSAMADSCLKSQRSMLKSPRKLIDKFENRLRRVWKPGLDTFDLINLLSYEIGAELNHQYRPVAFERGDILFDVLMRLHARACRTMSEIGVLLRSGYPDAAHARWRLLHEVAVVCKFIADHGDKAARLCVYHDQIHTYLAMKEYQLHCEALGDVPYSVDEVLKAEARHNRILARMGKDFALPYGWAAKILGVPRCGLERLERAVGLEKYRPYYRMASYNVHSYSRSMLFSLSMPSGMRPLLPAGPGNAGLADPGHQSCLTLAIVNSSFCLHWNSIQIAVLMKAILKLVDIAGAQFMHSHDAIKSEYEEDCVDINIKYKSVNLDQ